MSSLYKIAVVRNPMPAPARQSKEPLVYTHPQPLSHASPNSVAGAKTREDVSLHDRLHAAFQAANWAQLAAVAREHLESDDVRKPLHPISSAAIRFFRSRASAHTRHDVETFLDQLDRGTMKEYLGAAAVTDWARLADRALALHCLGALGEAPTDPISELRALATFAAFSATATGTGPTTGWPPGWPDVFYGGELPGGLGWNVDIAFPEWAFEIDVCGQPASVPIPAKPALTPLELKLQKMEQMKQGKTGGCNCEPGTLVCTPQSVCCPELKYYVGELLELRDWTHRYKAGDLAYIEVVGAGEQRTREHEMRRTKEVFIETETSTRSLDKRDHQVTESGSLQREIERQKETTRSGDASVDGKYNAGAYSASVSAKLSYNKSASETLKEAQEQAREAVTSAVAELEKQARVTRSERVTTEESEKNIHLWSNEKGDEPKVTKYFWVTQEKRAQLYSHGKRVMVELIIPSPATLYEAMMMRRLEAEVDRRLPRIDGADPKVSEPLTLTADDISTTTYTNQMTEYHASGSVSAPPDSQTTVMVSANYGRSKSFANLGQIPVHVPDGYEAVSMVLSGGPASFLNGGSSKYIHFALGGATVWFGSGANGPSAGLPNMTGDIAIDVTAQLLEKCDTAFITIICNVTDATMDAWRQSVFDLIKAAHDAKISAEQQALHDWLEKKAENQTERTKLRQELAEQQGTRNPFFNKEITQTELKRAAIYLMCEDFSAESAWIRMAEPCGLPEIDRHAAATRGYGWYFWDRVFDWKYMAYAFFDYIWNPICDWDDRFDIDEPDAMFKAFRQAGYARVLIPVSPAMEKDFLYYAASLQKWGHEGDPPVDEADPRWRNVLYELKYASESAMMPREGYLDHVVTGSVSVLMKGTKRYWDSDTAQVDAAAVAADVDREIFIDGAIYLVASIAAEPGSPPYNSNQPDAMWWRVTLDRPYEGTTSARRLYAFGARAVAPAFSFDMPTDLIWAGAHDKCLPTYPLPRCGE